MKYNLAAFCSRRQALRQRSSVPGAIKLRITGKPTQCNGQLDLDHTQASCNAPGRRVVTDSGASFPKLLLLVLLTAPGRWILAGAFQSDGAEVLLYLDFESGSPRPGRGRSGVKLGTPLPGEESVLGVPCQG